MTVAAGETFVDLLSNQKGVVAVVVALCLVVFLSMAALVVDIGNVVVAKHNLQNLVDAAALAGSRQLGWLYEQSAGMKGNGGSSVNTNQVTAVAQEVASKNQLSQNPATVFVTVGTWNATTGTFASSGQVSNAVEVTANATIPTFVAGVMGINTLSVSATARAALTSLAQASAGQLILPLGIAKGWFGRGNTSIMLSLSGEGKQKEEREGKDKEKDEDKDKEDEKEGKKDRAGEEGKDEKREEDKEKDKVTADNPCVGWHTFTEAPATEQQLEQILKNLQSSSYSSPSVTAGQTQFQFLGGKVETLGSQLKSLVNVKKDPATGQWSTPVAVYDRNPCTIPTGPITTVGFATANISLNGNTLNLQISTDLVLAGRGGGPDYGTLGSLPNLVQ